jgi:hypothetical protein
MEKCQGIMGKLFGHNFQEATDSEDAGLTQATIEEISKIGTVSRDQVAAIVAEAAVPVSYKVQAVYCTRCGHTIKLNKGEES